MPSFSGVFLLKWQEAKIKPIERITNLKVQFCLCVHAFTHSPRPTLLCRSDINSLSKSSGITHYINKPKELRFSSHPELYHIETEWKEQDRRRWRASLIQKRSQQWTNVFYAHANNALETQSVFGRVRGQWKVMREVSVSNLACPSDVWFFWFESQISSASEDFLCVAVKMRQRATLCRIEKSIQIK